MVNSIEYQWDKNYVDFYLKATENIKESRTYYNHESAGYKTVEMTAVECDFCEYQSFIYIDQWEALKVIDDIDTVAHWTDQEKALWLLGIKQERVETVLKNKACQTADFESRNSMGSSASFFIFSKEFTINLLT